MSTASHLTARLGMGGAAGSGGLNRFHMKCRPEVGPGRLILTRLRLPGC